MFQIHCLKAANINMKDTFNSYLNKQQYKDINSCKKYAEKLYIAYPDCVFSVEFERKDMSYRDYLEKNY